MPAKIRAVTGSRTSKGSLFKVNPENLSHHRAKISSTPWDWDRYWCLQCLLTREGWGLLPEEVLPLIKQIRTWRRMNLCIGLCLHLTTWSYIECWSGDRWHVTGNRWNVNIYQYFVCYWFYYMLTLRDSVSHVYRISPSSINQWKSKLPWIASRRAKLTLPRW